MHLPLLTLAFTCLSTFVIADGGPWAAFFSEKSANCDNQPANAVVGGGFKPNCDGTCHIFGSAVNTAMVWGHLIAAGPAGKFTSCDVYPTRDCTGNFQTVRGVSKNQCVSQGLTTSSWSAHCYYDC
ncbi:hypothetical protein BT69DRAFT_405037 [Atractiella rhizophila]|nr:hypothetical protein BT69DRAFT_390517 [Atractiella rhizophila]KAH8928828.1 hypothetical protein BT69DRAFT_405037 [Atractiella rhizophila]